MYFAMERIKKKDKVMILTNFKISNLTFLLPSSISLRFENGFE